MRIGILEKDQPVTEIPTRFISKGRAARFIERGYAKEIKPNILQMVKQAEEIRGDIRFYEPHWIPRIKAPRRPEGLLLWYPHKDQFTCARG
jgi:hypothetical protein